MTDVTVTLIDEIIEAFNGHDIEGILAYFSEDGQMISASGSQGRGAVFKGKESIENALRARFAACPDIQWVEGNTWVYGNKAVSEFRVIATLPEGEKLDTLGCDLWEFFEGKIIKKDTYYKQP
ncbi:nuclear transport factor 2 family protein [Pseudomonas sp. GD03651]|uniref:nuclear transport factor 2 family protein n=1 Tax=Pseudomonas TaxID=286 RepID=UPI0005B38C71|nr:MULTISPECIES: nuclear transport factor 2 family protein [Pseudomonas]QPN42778.1 nuclear transport factor 2 family protein [Priestia aryabhattai]MDD2007019.1 nuclear transport factor 2 family protein [Pseudomonas putida]MDH2186893.1 nuclear transport factor 2 family protein [Pseudomonas sp. GD03651]HDS1809492.1 nuclear transport factor 2 family protein [Pseudomonas putida]HDS3807603.1 nuclear transport factor 2 family protein [Pseudomonas putida]